MRNHDECGCAASQSWIRKTACAIAIAFSCLLTFGALKRTSAAPADKPMTFSTPQAAADALIDAVEKFDVPALEALFGPEGEQIIHTGEAAQDREIAKQFAGASSHEDEGIGQTPSYKESRHSSSSETDNSPFPVPIVKVRHDVVFRFEERD